jgi:tetratricopeptide (TPR) repeat protein
MTKRPQPKLRAQTPAHQAGVPLRQANSTVEHRRPIVTTPTAAPSSPPLRATYVEAVAIYEKGIEALQRHDYNHALELLQSVLRQYPEEKELHERVRLYLNICERHATPREAAPQSVEERLYASTLAINGGRYDEAISHLRLVRDEDPDNDHALYMLAVAHAQRGEHAEAIAHLERAIALNPENRALARRDPDLEPLHDDDAFRGAIDSPPMSRLDPDRFIRRPPFRPNKR